VLLVKLPYLEKWHAMRQGNAAFYDSRLGTNGKIKIPAIAYKREYHIYNQYVISVTERDAVRKALTDNNIGTEIYYPVPFHEQECFQYLGYKSGDFPCSENAAKHTFALPIYPELTEEMLQYVADTMLRC
jgi:dTDP-4-amino-4,6-dideoxygalactose transaminase